LYKDQTSLSNDNRVFGYPLMMSLANKISCEQCPTASGHKLIVVLPMVTSLGKVKSQENPFFKSH
jgi:hypothetical protein